LKDLALREKAEYLKILGHPTRLSILDELLSGAKCVTDIKDLLDIPQTNVSQHLNSLRREKIVDYYEDGKLRCYYILRPKLVKNLFKFIDGDYPIVERSPKSIRREGQLREQRTALAN
jgi:ArsR family transcriptional regulator